MLSIFLATYRGETQEFLGYKMDNHKKVEK
jgi:hypothetical protein